MRPGVIASLGLALNGMMCLRLSASALQVTVEKGIHLLVDLLHLARDVPLVQSGSRLPAHSAAVAVLPRSVQRHFVRFSIISINSLALRDQAGSDSCSSHEGVSLRRASLWRISSCFQSAPNIDCHAQYIYLNSVTCNNLARAIFTANSI